MPKPESKATKLQALQDHRAQEMRAAADRAERAGQPFKAIAFRNAAYFIEQEGKQ